jgi:hypothetical protein
MSSNKYYDNWKNCSSQSQNNSSKHSKIIKKLDDDISRLDRAIDKIKTEEKVQKIFSSGRQNNLVFQQPFTTHVGAQFPVISGSPLAVINGSQLGVINGISVAFINGRPFAVMNGRQFPVINGSPVFLL